jgi:hypothetical protein
VKKLISIGVALALLAMVVLPVGVGAATTVVQPSTYAKIPFAIVQSGFYMVGCMLGDIQALIDAVAPGALPFSLTLLKGPMFLLGDWVGIPLAWSVDMMIAGLGLTGDVLGGLQPIIEAVAPGALPFDLTLLNDLFKTVESDLKACWYADTCNNASQVYVVPCA